MARNKDDSPEKLVFLLDVGPSMHSVLPEVEKVCTMLVQKKLIYSKNDEVGVVIFGTEDTNNELTKELGGYKNIVVLQDIKVVDRDAIDTLQKLPRGTVNGDFMDAIVVGMDMLIKKYKDAYKGRKRLCLITNAIHPIKDSLEGSKENQVKILAVLMTAQGMKIESVVVRGGLSQDANKGIMDENDQLLSILSKRTRTKIVYVDSLASLQPNEQQQKAANESVQMPNLAPSGEEKSLLPEFNVNSVLEWKKSDRLVLQEKPSCSKEEDGNADVTDAQAANSTEKAPVVVIEKIGDITPVQDFEEIMSRRDTPEWVGIAIRGLRDKILELVDSHEGDNYIKAVECIAALRKGCILEQEPGPYNNLIRYLYQDCLRKGISSFPQLLASSKLTLISKSEAADSAFTDEQAQCYLDQTEPKH